MVGQLLRHAAAACLLNGNTRTKTSLVDRKYFTGEFRADVSYLYSFNRPSDHTLIGSSESGRPNEFQLQQLGIGGDCHAWDANVPYFAGSGGSSPPGGNSGAPGSVVSGWSPDLRKLETRINLSMLVKL